jgi:protein-disulfide isomerase
MSRARSTLEVTTTLAVLVVTILIGWVIVTGRRLPAPVVRPEPPTRVTRPPEPPSLPSRPVSIADAIVRGDRAAPVAIIAYSEFQCPFCARFAAETMPALEAEYLAAGKAMLVFKHLPLESIHPEAFKAAESAECAGEQGRFWQMHDRLFANQRGLFEQNLRTWGAEIGLDQTRFTECLAGRMTARVRGHMEEAREFGIGGTPAFLIGRVDGEGRVQVTDRITGARPVGDFHQVLGRLLNAATN